MRPIAIVLGAPNAPVEPLLRALEARGVVSTVGFDLGSLCERLREATQHRAQVWQGVGARSVAWIEPALAQFARLLVEALAHRALHARSATGSARSALGAALALWSPRASEHALQLSRWLPNAKWIAVVADGTLARATDEAAGYEWAQNWTAAVSAAHALAIEAGERVLTVRSEDFEASPERALDRIAAWLGVTGNAASAALPSREAVRLAGAGLRGFLAHPRAGALMREFAYQLPTLAEAPLPPAIVARRAHSLIELGELELAEQELSRAPRTAEVWLALGALRGAQGNADEAAAAQVRALKLDERASAALIALFDASRAEALELAPRARAHNDVRVRSALARWLVRRGLDAEAAEIVASVEHQAWR